MHYHAKPGGKAEFLPLGSLRRSEHMPDYVHPEVLVSTAWVAEHLSDPGVRIVESDEDRALYTQGHIPGAV